MVRHNLAYYRGAAGDPAAAAKACQELLKDYLRVPGDRYPESMQRWINR